MDELNRLIQMATEAEALERDAEAATEVGAEPRSARPLVVVTWRRTVLLSLAGVSGLAACLTVAVMMQGQPAVPGKSVAGTDRSSPDRAVAMEDTRGPDEPVPPSPESVEAPAKVAIGESVPPPGGPAAEDTQSVVFALFRATDGSYECVQVDQPEWGHAMADVGRGELMKVAFRNPCTSVAPQVLVIGVEGRRGTVPTTMGDAQRLADRLRTAPMHHSDLSSLAYAALPDLPAGSMVVAESVAIR